MVAPIAQPHPPVDHAAEPTIYINTHGQPFIHMGWYTADDGTRCAQLVRLEYGGEVGVPVAAFDGHFRRVGP